MSAQAPPRADNLRLRLGQVNTVIKHPLCTDGPTGWHIAGASLNADQGGNTRGYR